MLHSDKGAGGCIQQGLILALYLGKGKVPVEPDTGTIVRGTSAVGEAGVQQGLKSGRRGVGPDTASGGGSSDVSRGP